MSWEAIIGFIFFALISSLFNKGKKETTPRKTINPSRTNDPTRTNNPPRPQSTTTAKPKVQPRRPSGLEDMLRELQRNMGEAFEQYSPKEQEPIKEEIVEKMEPVKSVVQQESSISSKGKVDTPITVGGIGRKSTGPKLDLDRKAVLQGIIMSEVLGKPKSLRGREIK